MKITKQKIQELKKAIKNITLNEDIGDSSAAQTAELAEILNNLLEKLDSLDISIDYLAAAVTGGTTVGIGRQIGQYGRAASPLAQQKHQEQPERHALEELIDIELAKELKLKRKS